MEDIINGIQEESTDMAATMVVLGESTKIVNKNVAILQRLATGWKEWVLDIGFMESRWGTSFQQWWLIILWWYYGWGAGRLRLTGRNRWHVSVGL